MNADAFLDEATKDLSRAAELLATGTHDCDVHDCLMFFAFGLERLFKAYLLGINPLYILEEPSFENSIAIVYSDRCKRRALKPNQEPNKRFITYDKAMTRAAHFSQHVQSIRGALTKVNDYRGIIVHVSVSTLIPPLISR